MNAPAGSALAQALELTRAPRGLRPGISEKLPNDMLLLLRLAAGEAQAVQQSQAATGLTADRLRESAVFYIQQVMFGAGGNSYRVLGSDHEASYEQLREHYRWLARWLHPDRNRDEWEAVYADRVNQAWQDLRTPDRRQRYDEERSRVKHSAAVELRIPIGAVRHTTYQEPQPASANLRWLPNAILAFLGLGVLVIVALFSTLRWAAPDTVPFESPDQLLSQDAEDKVLSRNLDRGEKTALAASVSDQALLASAAASELAQSDAAKQLHAAARALPEPSIAPDKESTATARLLPEVAEAAPKLARLAESSREPRTQRILAASRFAAIAPPPQAPAPDAPKHQLENEAVADASSSLPERTDPPPLQIAPEDLEAKRLLRTFRGAYADGDLERMRMMFAADVRSHRGQLDAILSDYRRLFMTTSQRSLSVRNVTSFTTGATLTIIASYQATVIAGNGRPHRSHGDLRLDLRKEGQEWRIYRLAHDERGG